MVLWINGFLVSWCRGDGFCLNHLKTLGEIRFIEQSSPESVILCENHKKF
jgi:hypothetical protein